MESAAIIQMNKRPILCPIHRELAAAAYVARYAIKPLQPLCFRRTATAKIAEKMAVLHFQPWCLCLLESLSVQGETQTFSHSADSGATMTKHFCSNCGSQLFGTNSAKPDRIHIKVGSMDDAEWFQPQCNVWANSRLPSTPGSPEVKDFATMPVAPAKI